MKRRHLIVFGLAVLAVVGFAPGAFAFQESTEQPPPEPELISETGDMEPAVVLISEDAEADEQPWTARFLIPLLVGSAILIVGGVGLYYLIAIKNRYRVVEG